MQRKDTSMQCNVEKASPHKPARHEPQRPQWPQWPSVHHIRRSVFRQAHKQITHDDTMCQQPKWAGNIDLFAQNDAVHSFTGCVPVSFFVSVRTSHNPCARHALQLSYMHITIDTCVLCVVAAAAILALLPFCRSHLSLALDRKNGEKPRGVHALIGSFLRPHS